MSLETSTPRTAGPLVPVAVVTGLTVVLIAVYLWFIAVAVPDSEASGISVGAIVVWGVLQIASGLLLWWHRSHPQAVFAGVFALFAIGAIAIGNPGQGAASLPLWFAVYALAAFAPLLPAALWTASAWLVTIVMQIVYAARYGQIIDATAILAVALNTGMFFIACFVVGFAIRSHRRQAEEQRERAELMQVTARARASEATALERNRMARELHDLAAHELMDILLSVRAAQIGGETSLGEIETKTERALHHIRSVVGALREGEDSGGPADPLDIAIPRLIELFRTERGMTVNAALKLRAKPDEAIARAVTSIGTEALANAARHAPGHAVELSLTADETRTILTVGNPLSGETVTPEAAGGGHGLTGSGERARLLGGTFSAGPEGDAWVLRLNLPTRNEESTS